MNFNSNDKKDRIDFISKKADIVYKKLIVLLATVGGSGSYAISENGLVSLLLFVIFTIFIIGVTINYFELNRLKKDIERIEDE